MKLLPKLITMMIVLTTVHVRAQQWLGSANSTGLLYRADKVKVGAGPLFLDWTYQNNWGGSANLWAGYIGFNAYRNNNDVKDMYLGDNSYTSKLVFEGSNGGFRWLYRAPVGNDSHLQHSLSELMALNSQGNLGVGTAVPLGRVTFQNSVASAGVAYPLVLSALAPDAASGSGVGLSFVLGGNNTEAQRSEQARITVKQTYYGVRPSFTIQMKDYNAPYEQFFDRFVVSPQGNVGIGTSNPSAKTQIHGNGAGTTALSIIENQASGSGAHFLSEGANNIKFQLVRTADGVANTELRTVGNSYINAVSGNVGIGTTSPASKLHISDGTGGDQLRFSRGTGTVRFGQDNNLDNLYLWNNNLTKTYMYWGADGNVGIGMSSPTSKLHIADGPGGDQLRLSRGTGAVRFGQDLNQDNLYLWNSNLTKTYMFWKSDGSVGVGTANPDAKLTVKGNIHAEEVKVDLSVPGPDYVFEPTYHLPSLESIKSYIDQNKHLPEVPSAKEMEANGVNLGEMNMLLLKKVEELTLHLINQQKEIEELKKRVENK